MGLSSEFSLRSPKVTQGQLSRENTKNRLSVPFYGEMARCTVSQPPPIERAGQTTGGSILRIFDSGHPRSPKVNYQGKTQSTFCTFLRRDGELHVLATTTNRKSGSNYGWVFSPNFRFRPPKVTQGQLSRKNTQNRLSVPFYGQMVRCTFSQPPPIERAGQTTGGSFLRILIQVTQGHPRSIIKEKHQKSTFCTFLRRDGALHVLATTTNRKSGSNSRWVFPPNFH